MAIPIFARDECLDAMPARSPLQGVAHRAVSPGPTGSCRPCRDYPGRWTNPRAHTPVPSQAGLINILFCFMEIRVGIRSASPGRHKLAEILTTHALSWTLTKGNSLLLFAFYVMLVIVFFVISVVLSMVFGVVFALLGQGTALLIANGILSGALGAAATMVFTAVLAAVHRQLAGPSAGNISRTFE